MGPDECVVQQRSANSQEILEGISRQKRGKWHTQPSPTHGACDHGESDIPTAAEVTAPHRRGDQPSRDGGKCEESQRLQCEDRCIPYHPVGSMWCAYVFAIIALLALRPSLK